MNTMVKIFFGERKRGVSEKTTKNERKYKTERKSKMGKQKIDREAPMASLWKKLCTLFDILRDFFNLNYFRANFDLVSVVFSPTFKAFQRRT